MILGLASGALSLFFLPQFAFTIGANAMFLGFLGLTAIKLPRLTADYLRTHARDEDTPAAGTFFVVLVVVVASMVSLFLNTYQPHLLEVLLGVTSILLGWFTVQALGALHYAYEYYQVSETASGRGEVEGGLEFPGHEDPDGMAFMYFS